MKVSQRLVERLRKMGLTVPDDEIYRVHPSRASREAGAWSWAIGTSPAVGSQHAMTVLMRAPRLTASWSTRLMDTDIHIDPVPEREMHLHPEGGRHDTRNLDILWERR